MTRRQWMWLWIWLLLFFIIFCVWNKLQAFKAQNDKNRVQTATTSIEPKSKSVPLVTEERVDESRDINLKIVKDENSIKISGLFHSKEDLERLKDEYKKDFEVKEGTIIIDKNANNNKIIELLPTLTKDFSKFKNGYLEYSDKKFTIDGVVDDADIAKDIGEKVVLVGNVLVDNKVTVDEGKKSNIEKENKKRSDENITNEDIQAKLDHLLKLNRVEFVFAKAQLTKRGKKSVDEVAKILNRYKNIRVEIGGHTDSIGSAKRNKILSQKRANAIKRYLVSKGIKADRLKAVGYGESRPLVKNDTKRNRQINRRVEFKIIGEK